MGQKTKIEWCDSTWNPIVGCSKVSSGCRNCYAIGMAARFSKPGQPFHGTVQTVEQVRCERYEEGLPQLSRTRPRWTGQTVFKPHKLTEPLRWRKPRRIFVCSMGDLFHESVTNEQIAAVYGVMAASPHTFCVLTKRITRAAEWYKIVLPSLLFECAEKHGVERDKLPHILQWPLPNVLLGVSVEDQDTADHRIPTLLQIPATKRFVSIEPMLGEVDIGVYLLDKDGLDVAGGWPQNHPGLDWCIVGCESGPGARECKEEWIRLVKNQCVQAGVPLFLKQMVLNGKIISNPELDGRVWNDFAKQ